MKVARKKSARRSDQVKRAKSSLHSSARAHARATDAWLAALAAASEPKLWQPEWQAMQRAEGRLFADARWLLQVSPGTVRK